MPITKKQKGGFYKLVEVLPQQITHELMETQGPPPSLLPLLFHAIISVASSNVCYLH